MINVDTSEELSIAGWIFTPIFLLREKTRSKKDPGNELLARHPHHHTPPQSWVTPTRVCHPGYRGHLSRLERLINKSIPIITMAMIKMQAEAILCIF